MFFLQEMIEKFLLVRESISAIFPPNLDATPKAYPVNNTLSKTEEWNQADLGYFDPYLNRVYKEGEIILIGKNVYYKNIVLFIQHFQSLVTFCGTALVKANIATSFQGSALE